MLEQLTLLLATPIAKAILNKFYEDIGDKLAEKAINLIPEKVRELGQLIWEKSLKQEPKKEKLLKNASENSKEAQEELTKYLNKALENNSDLKQEAQKLAEEIYQNIEIKNTNAENIQQIFGGKGEQFNTKDIKAPIIQGGQGHHVEITYNTPPSS